MINKNKSKANYSMPMKSY